MSDTYGRAYTEILEILEKLPRSQYDKIPKSEIVFFNTNRDKEYEFKYNSLKTLKEQNVSRKTATILVYLYEKYFCSEKQKEKLERVLIQNENERENKLKEKYKYEDIFKNKNNLVP